MESAAVSRLPRWELTEAIDAALKGRWQVGYGRSLSSLLNSTHNDLFTESTACGGRQQAQGCADQLEAAATPLFRSGHSRQWHRGSP